MFLLQEYLYNMRKEKERRNKTLKTIDKIIQEIEESDKPTYDISDISELISRCILPGTSLTKSELLFYAKHFTSK